MVMRTIAASLCGLVICSGCDLTTLPPAVQEIERAAESIPAPADPAPVPCYLPGVLVPDQRLDVVAPAAGYLDLDGLDLGAAVAESEVLFVVRDDSAASRIREVDAELAQAHSALRRADADVTQRRQEQAAAEALGDLVSRAEVRDARSDLARARADRERARAAIAAARARSRRVRDEAATRTSLAPFSGRVTNRYADQGAFVSAGKPILRFVRGGESRLRFAAPERQAARLVPGQRIRWTTLDGAHGEATIMRASTEVDATSELVVFEARADQGRELLATQPAGASLRIGTAACGDL